MMSSFIVLSSHSLTEILYLCKYQIVPVRAALWFLKGSIGKCAISVMVTPTRRNTFNVQALCDFNCDIWWRITLRIGAWGSVVVKALRYLSDGPRIDSRWCHGFFPWYP